MARRMFSPNVVCSDAFLDMPISSQALYFQLGMAADDDGFVNPRKTMRMIGVSDDDLKILITKRFVLPFENGVIVIKHWRINNLVRKDFYRPTVYSEEKALLLIKPNMAYTLDEIQGKRLLTNRTQFRKQSVHVDKDRIGKDRIGKTTLPAQSAGETGEEPFNKFWGIYPKKVGKSDAHRAWQKLRPSQELSTKIIDSVFAHLQAPDWKRERGRFIPHPATYLNQGRWDDEIELTLQAPKVLKY